MTSVPIRPINGIELVPTQGDGIAKVHVSKVDEKSNLSWDRFVRLSAAADLVQSLGQQTSVSPSSSEAIRILDAGGYDGALGLFLPNATMDLIDPATTGGSLLNIAATDRAYDIVTAIDVLEHIEPSLRDAALREICRVCKRHVIINYPCQASSEAQNLVLNLTNNALVKQHVEWKLPDTAEVCAKLAALGFETTVKAHTSTAIWLAQYTLQNLAPEAAAAVNLFLTQHFANEVTSAPLYHLIHGKRC